MFGTTKGFLDYFSLKKLDDLPPLADLSDWESLRVQLNLPEVEGQDGTGESSDVDIESTDSDTDATDGNALPVLYPEGVDEQAGEAAADDEELAVSEWPQPVG